MFGFICYVSIHLEISAMAMRSAPEEISKRRRKATIANTTGLRVLTAIAAAVQIRLMELDLLFVAKRVASCRTRNRITWFCRDK